MLGCVSGNWDGIVRKVCQKWRVNALRNSCQNSGKCLVLEMLCKFGGDGTKSATLSLSKCVLGMLCENRARKCKDSWNIGKMHEKKSINSKCYSRAALLVVAKAFVRWRTLPVDGLWSWQSRRNRGRKLKVVSFCRWTFFCKCIHLSSTHFT